jgi:hypothetical protein
MGLTFNLKVIFQRGERREIALATEEKLPLAFRTPNSKGGTSCTILGSGIKYSRLIAPPSGPESLVP